MQNRLAGLAIGPSTLRNQGSPGVVAQARKHLKGINLRHFAVHSRPAFAKRLNAETARLRRALPDNAQNWGSARKALNIFLRDVLYHRLLCKFYDLSRLEEWLEVPLDSQVAKGIRLEAPDIDLPKWSGVKHVTPEESSVYQAAAALIASKNTIARVHLDLRWWRPEAKPGRRI